MRIAFTVLMACLFFNLFAQDIHFSHIHASPTIVNPAMTGLINNGNIRFIANARTQWQSVTNGYKTVAGSVDGKMFGLSSDNYLGAGLQLTGDKAGDLGFSKMSAGVALSGLKALDQRGDHYITFGMRGSLYHYRVDYSKMVGFDNEPMIEAGAPDAFSFFDLSAGMAWYYNYNDDNTVYIGGALFHINDPNTSFFNRIEDTEMLTEEFYGYEKLYRKIVFHGGANLQLSGSFTLLPTFLFTDQGPHQEINMGTFVKFLRENPRAQSESSFYIGTWIRYQIEKEYMGPDAMIAAIRLDINNTYLTFSFDFNLSTLSPASFGAGGPELSVIQVLTVPKELRKNHKVRCPAF